MDQYKLPRQNNNNALIKGEKSELLRYYSWINKGMELIWINIWFTGCNLKYISFFSFRQNSLSWWNRKYNLHVGSFRSQHQSLSVQSGSDCNENGKFLYSLVPIFLLQNQLTIFVIVAEVKMIGSLHQNQWFILFRKQYPEWEKSFKINGLFYSESNTQSERRVLK